MKKILAILMAVLMLVSFAACGGNGEDETTTADPEVTTEAPANGEVEETTAAGEEATEEVTEVVTDESGEEVTDEEGNAVTEVVTEEKTEKPSKEDGKKPTQQSGKKPVSQWSKQEILDYYNKAVIASDEREDKLQGQSKMILGYGGKITADGGLGGVLKIVSPIIDDTLKRNSSSTSNIPGYGEIKMSDLKSIKATEKNGIITVELVAVEQTDGPEADGSAGPVGRVIGTLGNINGALNELGAEISRGRETVTLTYTDVTVKADIDANTGYITGGRYHYLVNILVKDADIKLVVKIGVKNLKAAVDYTVTF